MGWRLRPGVLFKGITLSYQGLQEGVEGDVANVVVAVGEETAEDVDGEHAQSRLTLDFHDREHGLVQDRVADVLGCVRVGGHTGKRVAHEFAGLGVALTKRAHEVEDANLEERIRDACDTDSVREQNELVNESLNRTTDIVLRRAGRRAQGLHQADEIGNKLEHHTYIYIYIFYLVNTFPPLALFCEMYLAELRDQLGVDLEELVDERHTSQEDGVVALREDAESTILAYIKIEKLESPLPLFFPLEFYTM